MLTTGLGEKERGRNVLFIRREWEKLLICYQTSTVTIKSKENTILHHSNVLALHNVLMVICCSCSGRTESTIGLKLIEQYKSYGGDIVMGRIFSQNMWFLFLYPWTIICRYYVIIVSSPRDNNNSRRHEWKSAQNFLLWIVHKLAWNIQHGDECTTLHALSERNSPRLTASTGRKKSLVLRVGPLL